MKHMSSVHDLPEPTTCRQCGSLIAPQTTQCRRCGRYRDAGAIESAVLQALVPSSMSKLAGTLILAAVIIIWQLVVVVATRGDAFPGASSYSLSQFGAMHGAMVLFGQWWRACTSMFLHHDLIHILMNLYALAIVAPLLESQTDRYRVWSTFLVGGAASMVGSHIWYGLGLTGNAYVYVSAGASGAVCALIGATYVYAKARHHTGTLAQQMLRWSLFMLVIGLFLGGLNINNAAHISGWVVGALLQMVYNRQPTVALPASKWMSLIFLILTLLSFSMAGMNMRESPAYLSNDGVERGGGFLMPSRPGTAWGRSDQTHAWNTCRDHLVGDKSGEVSAEQRVEYCELNARINGFQPASWRMLERAYLLAENPRLAQRAAGVYTRLGP